MQSSRDLWLTEGLSVLAVEGEPAVRVDRLARRLGLTKGSFHHHFQGVDDYRRALLERYEGDQLAALDRLAAASVDLDPGAVLVTLPARAAHLLDSDLERAVRGWAVGDPAARAVQARVDEARLALLEGLWRRRLGDERRARVAALVPHLIAIGASVAEPRLGADELRAVYDLLAALASTGSGGGALA